MDVNLYINKIFAAIPKTWKNVLKIPETDQSISIKSNKIVQMIEERLNGKTSKQIYELLKPKKQKTRWETDWEDKYGEQQWNLIYPVLRNKLADRRSIEIHWKGLNFGLNTDEKLKKMRMSNGLCSLCNIETETIEHLFYECELVDRTWAVIQQICQKLWNNNINSASVIIMILNKEANKSEQAVLHYLILSVKYIIWKRRNLVRYEEIWTSESAMESWVKNYLIKRTELLLKSKIKKDIRKELEILLNHLKTYE